MTSTLSLLVASANDADGVAAALDAREEVSATRIAPADVATAATSRDPPPDALVLADGATLSADAVAALDAVGAPVVAFGEQPPEAPYVEGFALAADGSVAQLVREVRHVLAGETRLQLRESRRRIARLHDGAAGIASARTFEELFEQTAEVAERVLSFDHSWLGAREGDYLVTTFRQGNANKLPERLPLDQGLAGVTYRTGEGAVIPDTRDDDRVYDPHDAIRSLVSVPVGDFGVFQTAATAAGTFDETDRQLAELLATHVGQAYERLRAEADLRERQRKVTELHEAAPELIDAASERELFELTVEIAERVLAFDRSYVLRDADDHFEMVATTDPDAAPRAPRRGILDRTFAEGRSFLVDDAQGHPDARPADDRSHGALSVPFGDDAVFQAIADEANAFDEADLELAELLVSYAAATRDRVRSEAALRESRRVIERLHDAAADLAAAETREAVLDRAIRAAEDVLSFDRCTISLLDEERQMLVPVAEPEGTDPDASRAMHVSEGVTGKTFRTGESILIDDVADSDDAAPAKPEYRSGLSVPIGGLGVCQAVATERHAFGDTDLELAELLMTHVAVALERVRAESDLRDERDRLSALFENIPDAAVSFEMVDGEPIAGAVNTAFEEVFGYSAEAVVGESVDDYIVPEGAATEAADLNEQLRSGENVRRECRRLTAEGPRDFLMYVVPLELDAENVGGFAIYSDITERKERERALRRQNERLDEFASVVSHDLRNPISIAEGFLDLAEETGDEAHFRKVSDALDRMRALVDDLLALAREGRVVGETESTSLRTAALSAWETVDTDDATLEVRAGGSADGGAPAVEADPNRLREVFENLFRNAVEHAGPGATVVVEATPDGFAVADDGPGVPAEVRGEVFDVGVTTSDEGTGFGLAIVRRIAEAHGWEVSLAEDTDGARFEFVT